LLLRRIGHLAAGLALLLLLGLASAGKSGNYIGCFDLALMELSPDNSQVRRHMYSSGTATELATAAAACRQEPSLPVT
jgi:hypothetical protein